MRKPLESFRAYAVFHEWFDSERGLWMTGDKSYLLTNDPIDRDCETEQEADERTTCERVPVEELAEAILSGNTDVVIRAYFLPEGARYFETITTSLFDRTEA